MAHAFIVGKPDRRPRFARQRGDERLQQFALTGEARWKLPQQRPELLAQAEQPGGEEIGQRLSDPAQPQQVRDVARSLPREGGVIGRLHIPPYQPFGACSQCNEPLNSMVGKRWDANSSSRRCTNSCG